MKTVARDYPAHYTAYEYCKYEWNRELTIQMPPGALDPGEAASFLAKLDPATEVARVPNIELPVGEAPVPIPFPAV